MGFEFIFILEDLGKENFTSISVSLKFNFYQNSSQKSLTSENRMLWKRQWKDLKQSTKMSCWLTGKTNLPSRSMKLVLCGCYVWGKVMKALIHVLGSRFLKGQAVKLRKMCKLECSHILYWCKNGHMGIFSKLCVKIFLLLLLREILELQDWWWCSQWSKGWRSLLFQPSVFV